MAIIRDEAVVLRRLEYSETSQIIVLFAREHGKIRVIAKGIKRSTKTRFAPGVDLLDIGHATINRRVEGSSNLATMTEWKQTQSLSGLREKLSRLHGAEYAAEVTAQLTEDWDPHDGLFDRLTTCLTELSEADEPLGAVVVYQAALLTAVGSMPVFDVCVRCRRETDLICFSSFEGGMTCRSCEPTLKERRRVLPATLDILRGKETPRSAEGAFALLNYHIAHLMGRSPLLAEKLLSPERHRLLPRGGRTFDRRG